MAGRPASGWPPGFPLVFGEDGSKNGVRFPGRRGWAWGLGLDSPADSQGGEGAHGALRPLDAQLGKQGCEPGLGPVLLLASGRERKKKAG